MKTSLSQAMHWQDRELLADSVLKAAWVNCRIPLLARYDMVDSTPAEWQKPGCHRSGTAQKAAEKGSDGRVLTLPWGPTVDGLCFGNASCAPVTPPRAAFVHASKAPDSPEPAMGQECSTDSCAVRRSQPGPVNLANQAQPGVAAAPAQKIDGYGLAQPRPSTVLLSHTYFEQDLDELRALPAGSARHMQERPLFRFRSGSSYTGQWLGNERHGLGVQQWFDGAVYQGTWEHNCAHGQGRFVHTDGDVYCGEWQMNVAHGLGTYTHRLSGSKAGPVPGQNTLRVQASL
eukprot:s5282_g4.t1